MDLLTGRVSLADALIEIARLSPHGASSRPFLRATPPRCSGSAPMRRLMDTLRTEFDRIVIDSAPTIVDRSRRRLPTLADGLVLVVRAGVTTKPAIARAVSSLGAARLLGMVFNESPAPQPTLRAPAIERSQTGRAFAP